MSEEDKKPAQKTHAVNAGALPNFFAFFSSGVFFMIVGAAILYVAYQTLSTTHSSFSFILVVTGVAILLYGTGTQGVGEIESQADRAKYKVQMAGGAGVLTFLTAFGIVWKSDDIKRAFQIEKRYFGLVMEPDVSDGRTVELDDFAAEITVNGLPAPSYRSGNQIVAHVPYFVTGEEQRFRIVATLHYIGRAEDRPPYVAVYRREEFELPIKLDTGARREIGVRDGSYDFPRYEEVRLVKLVTDNDIASTAELVDRRAVASQQARPPTSNLPPVKFAIE